MDCGTHRHLRNDHSLFEITYPTLSLFIMTLGLYVSRTRIIIAVISIALYLTDMGELTALYKINNNVYIKTSKIINYVVIILYHTHTHTHRKSWE